MHPYNQGWNLYAMQIKNKILKEKKIESIVLPSLPPYGTGSLFLGVPKSTEYSYKKLKK